MSKIYVDSSISFIDSSNFKFLLGHRLSLFSLINPFLLQYSLKTGFLFLESFVTKDYDFIFISDIKDSILFNKFHQICKKNKYSLLKISETSSGFLTNKKISRTVVITLFLDHEKTGLICDGNNLDEIYTSINLILENDKYLEYGKAAKENAVKFRWINIIEDYKKILS